MLSAITPPSSRDACVSRFAKQLGDFGVQRESMTNRRTECLSGVALALWFCALASPATAVEGLPDKASAPVVESGAVLDAELPNLASDEAINQAATAARLDVDPRVNGSVQDAHADRSPYR